MIYTDERGVSFELPKMTLALEEKYKAVKDCTDTRERVQMQLDLMTDALGTDYVREVCGGTTADTVDIASLNVLFTSVRFAYSLGDLACIVNTLNEVMPTLEKFERVEKIVGSLNNSRQGFRNVV